MTAPVTPVPLGVASETRPGTRAAAVAGWVLLFGGWVWLIGIPNDTVGVIVWIWLFTIAWDIEAPRGRHLDFWRSWWVPVAFLVAYWLLRGLVDNLGIPVHVRAPIRFDEWLGGGTTPTELLQRDWCGDPCLKTTPPRWFDTALTTVYATHFVTALTIAGVLWMRDRGAWGRWLRRFITLNLAGLVIYAAYPMAPPWMASRDGFIGEVHRTTSRGWSELGLHRTNMVLHGMANQVAAMPSLHAGTAFLVAFYAVTRLRSPLRWLLLLYPAAMSLALVYFAEHYVLDVLVGGLLAAVVTVGCGIWERRHPRAPDAGQ